MYSIQESEEQTETWSTVLENINRKRILDIVLKVSNKELEDAIYEVKNYEKMIYPVPFIDKAVDNQSVKQIQKKLIESNEKEYIFLADELNKIYNEKEELKYKEIETEETNEKLEELNYLYKTKQYSKITKEKYKDLFTQEKVKTRIRKL